MIHNPILRGFNPDPSICRVGEDYYLVTSSFSYFPGVPVYHSRDLMHWERLCYALDRKEQLHVTYEDLSLGIFAPTIRWHDNTFYLIATNMTTHQNFFCTATDPAGPWTACLTAAVRALYELVIRHCGVTGKLTFCCGHGCCPLHGVLAGAGAAGGGLSEAAGEPVGRGGAPLCPPARRPQLWAVFFCPAGAKNRKTGYKS